jgi:L-alanine-DL-glutamate epimerase-like enolase superfamily enzyme
MTDMTIKAVHVSKLHVPWPHDPWLKGHKFGDVRNILVLEIETQGGIVGMGYLHLFRPAVNTINVCLEESIIPRVLGKEATAVEAIWDDLWTYSASFGRGGITTMAMSALDIALWDAIGKHANLPLHRLWGHFGSELAVYGSGCFRGTGGDGMIAKAIHYKERGFKAIKMQVAHTNDLKGDLDNVRRMREALGSEIDIMIDVNMGWTADVAIQMGRKFEDYGVYWLEEPVRPEDYDGYKRIARALDLRIVGGETHFTRFDLMPFFEEPVLPILQPDPMRGGLADLRKTAAIAESKGIKIAPHLFPELNVHLLASIPNGIWIEEMGISADLWVEPVPIVNGTITAPERPGNGLAFKPEILQECRVG